MRFSSILLLFLSISSMAISKSQPLSTQSRWIVDENGRRTKLACVNWPSHLETLLAEGLSKRSMDDISSQITSMGFNCVRLTWALFMATNDTLGGTTVRDNFKNLGLNEAIKGLEANNPELVDLPIIKAYQEVVSKLGKNNIMVILDNHISKPGWCCSRTDGNGFFGDEFFQPQLWMQGLKKMGSLFRNSTNVIGMSLRNELRGPRENANDWYKYMALGAEEVHAANPNVLVILSGLNFDNDLSFLSNRNISVTFNNKLVFEVHWYSFSDGSAWREGNHNQVCGRITGNVIRKAGFLVQKGWPLFMSEFGTDQRGGDIGGNRYMSCMLGSMAALDLDFALWTLQGDYYLRQGTVGLEEVYGVLNKDWSGVRNATYLQRIASIQLPFQGPGLPSLTPYKVVYHPATGLCVVTRGLLQQPMLGSCLNSEAWSYTDRQTMTLKNTPFCLQANGAGESATLTMLSCTNWTLISDSKMHVSTTISGKTLCLDVNENKSIITNPCRCLSGDKSCDADWQWFKIITSSRSIISNNEVGNVGSDAMPS